MKRLIRNSSIESNINLYDLNDLPKVVEKYKGYDIRKGSGKYSVWKDHEFYGDANRLEDVKLIVDCLDDDTKVAASTKLHKRSIKSSVEVIDGVEFDLWYKNTFDDVCSADCTFYPNGGYYAGNVYDCSGKIIGDYTSKDSVTIEKLFPGIFGE